MAYALPTFHPITYEITWQSRAVGTQAFEWEVVAEHSKSLSEDNLQIIDSGIRHMGTNFECWISSIE